MSILAETAATQSVKAVESNDELRFIVLWCVIALALGIILKTRRRGNVVGPLRVDADRPLWPLWVVCGVGFIVWFFSSNILAVALFTARAREKGVAPGVNPVELLTARDWAMLGIIPAAVGFVALFGGDAIAGRRLLRSIGIDFGHLLGGVPRGVVAIVITMPVILVASVLLELIYLRVGYQHPMEHELLGKMRSATPATRMALIFAAVVCAPFFEEYLFRGHLQTGIRELLVRLSNPPPTFAGYGFPIESLPLNPPADPIAAGGHYGYAQAPQPAIPAQLPAEAIPGNVPPAGAAPLQSLPLPAFDAVLPLPAPSPSVPDPLPRAWQSWVAIGITAALFAMVHDIWSWPLIFLLAVFLGYAYERTGNLWVTITMHAFFNLIETLYFLFSR